MFVGLHKYLRLWLNYYIIFLKVIRSDNKNVLPREEESGRALPGAAPLAGYHASKGRPPLDEANQFGQVVHVLCKTLE